MRRIVVWSLSTLSVLVLLLGYSTSTSGPLATGESTSFVSGTSAGTAASSTTGSTGSGRGSSGSSTGTTVTGDVVQTRFGPVQVQLRMAGSSIDSVQVLQYPNGNQKDAEISSRALPVLIQETIDQQSAAIDMVSGATYTSQGYLESLQSALDQVGA